jgi:hypothetical protein
VPLPNVAIFFIATKQFVQNFTRFSINAERSATTRMPFERIFRSKMSCQVTTAAKTGLVYQTILP